jgi:hypothetical protein
MSRVIFDRTVQYVVVPHMRKYAIITELYTK